MSETKIDGTPVKPVPANIPEELIPVYEWFTENGKDFLLQIAIVVAVFIAAFSFVKYRASRAQAAAASLLSANDVVGLEEINGKFGGSKVGPLIRLRLARAYYDEGKYDLAKDTFEAFVKSNSKHQLAEEAKLGLAASLEALEKFAEAKAVYESVESATGAPAWALARLGSARCLAASGDKVGAEKLVDAFAAEVKGSAWEKSAENEKNLIERFDGFRKSAGVFEKMDALAGAQAPADAADVASEPAVPAEAAPAAPAEK